MHKKITSSQIQEITQTWSIHLPEHVHQSLANYLTFLMKWNKAMNLVGVRRWQDCLNTLIIDSVYLSEFLRALPLPQGCKTWDLGAGAGLPGIPLRMLWQDGIYHLLEVREKRALFLENALAQLQSAQLALPNTFVFHGKVEDFFEQNMQNNADMLVSRAFMPWVKLLQLAEPVLKTGGRVIFLANEAAPRQILPALGGVCWNVENEAKYSVGQSIRYFWSIQKVK